MTELSEQELRPIAKGWPGLRSNLGRLVRIPGEMARCVNVEIDVPDTLAKRRGIVRGVEEYFDAPVCGLFSYTDFCQNEFLLVATEDGIFVRQPLALPIFQFADCYPFDDFGGDPVEGVAPDADKWKFQVGGLETRSDTLGLLPTALSVGLDDFETVLDSTSISWFKEACSSGYRVEIDVDLPEPTGGLTPRAWILMKGFELGFQSGAFLIGEVFRDAEGTKARLLHVDETRTLREVAKLGPIDDANVAFRVSYDATTNKDGKLEATLRLDPDIGTTVTTAVEFSSLEDAAFGLASGVALLFTGVTGQVRPASFPAPLFAVDLIDAGSF